ncbi:MAG TPA: tetratricopeptide repeat protein, partial [Nannocystaceae bacterium]|nr:tetratricopeptide repeat protein [Nannocystaceae bacterium]
RRDLAGAERWVRHAEVEYARLEPTPLLTARLANAHAGLYMFSNELERAVAEFRTAATACPLVDCASGVSITMNLAAVLWRMGEADEAERLRRAALGELERRFGTDSPASIQARLDLVHSLTQSGRIDEADTHLVQAEALVDRWTEPTHRYRVLAADQRAEILIARGDPGGAVELLERSFAIVDKTFPPDDLRRVSRLNDLAFAYLVSGRGDEALTTIARARDLTERVDSSSFEHGALMVSSGYIKGELGDYEGALADLHEARRVIEPLLTAQHPIMRQCDTNEARVLVLAGRQAEALPIWEAAVKASEGAKPGDRAAVDSRIALAECLVDLERNDRALEVLDGLTGQPFEFSAHPWIIDFVRARATVARDREGALALARAARSALRRYPTVDASVIDTWLAANGGAER